MKYVPEENYYTKDHEWAYADENLVTIGITEYAQTALGEVVYLDLPDIGQRVVKEESFGVVESVKAMNDLIAPVSGIVIEVNDVLLNNLDSLNDDPMNNGWLVKVEIDNEKELLHLLKAADYKKIIDKKKK
ncbi:MAG: glycine cleavage system protein GcvH [Bdellovibrionales bacterium]|nr:glycine cleavage system protein GcvH [Bdellovibrionales bacterium]